MNEKFKDQMKSMGVRTFLMGDRQREELEELAIKLLDDNGNLKIMPTSFYEDQDHDAVRLFCHFFARYGLPTLELVKWLKNYIGERSAIEIGAGCGDLGRALNIPMTDNFCQTWPDVQNHYLLAGQPVIRYGGDVECLDALEAVKKYKPDVVIGQWVTHWIDPALPVPPGGGNMYGIKEDLLLKECKEYIVIGSRNVHGHKPILKLPHNELQSSFIKSRTADPKQNVIYIWQGEMK